MGKSMLRFSALTALVLLTAACASDRDPILMNITRGERTPDEFGILPNKPIELPEDLAALPDPTPDQGNRADPNPFGDAVAALGGNPDRLRLTGVARADQGMFSYASRYGVDPTIRQDLAAADLEFRRKNNGRLLERLFKVNVYYDVYAVQELDQYAELERFRRLGVRTVAAPPQPVEE